MVSLNLHESLEDINGTETIVVKSASPFLPRGDPKKLQQIFNKYASVEIDGEKYITTTDFIRKFLGLLKTEDYNRLSCKILGGIIDTSKDELISFDEFLEFEGLLCVPDALYSTAFQLFDTSGNGQVSFDEFESIINHTTLQKEIPFNLNGEFVRLYFGKNKKNVVAYNDFCQFMHDFHEEYGTEAFRLCQKDGFITVDDFNRIMTLARSHLLTEDISKHLSTVAKNLCPDDKVSFPFFVAFNLLINNTELVKKIYLEASKGKRDVEVNKGQFYNAAKSMSHMTPLQVEILFQLCELITQEPTIVLNDINLIAPVQYFKKFPRRIVNIKVIESKEERSLFIEALEFFYRFVIGSAAGAIGATAVYPMDLIKTRMQNQRRDRYMYKNNWDCFVKSYNREGLRGMYKGVLPQLFGVGIGKAIKLAVNDFIRDHLMNKKGQVPLLGEIFAGSIAGAVNAFIVNPLEMIKIRIQVGGEVGKKITTMYVLKDVGIFGMQKGIVACLLRDVPFCAIFFPVYARTKTYLEDANGYNTAFSLLAAGAVASIPPSPLSMPFDVIKTRLQVKPRPGNVIYKGVIDAWKRIVQLEGSRALWQGARMVKPSTQFGVTLLMYEVLQRMFYIDFAGTRPTGSEGRVLVQGLEQIKSDNPDHIGGYAVALPILSGIESKFGLVLPKFEHNPQSFLNKLPNSKHLIDRSSSGKL